MTLTVGRSVGRPAGLSLVFSLRFVAFGLPAQIRNITILIGIYVILYIPIYSILLDMKLFYI